MHMLTLPRSLHRNAKFVGRLPGFLFAMGIAEFFFHFHSFTLECLAFLATWLAIDAVLDCLLGFRKLGGAAEREIARDAGTKTAR
jgi:hypothetical protein